MAPVSDLEARIARLEARVRATEDVLAIHALKARYGELTDARYGRDGPVAADEIGRLAEELAGLFTEDAVWDGGRALGVARGRDEIRERLASTTLDFSWHLFTNPRIEVDGDTARGSWLLLAPCTRGGRPHWMAGAEDDEYRRVDGRWLHSRMALRVAFFAPHESGWAKR